MKSSFLIASAKYGRESLHDIQVILRSKSTYSLTKIKMRTTYQTSEVPVGQVPPERQIPFSPKSPCDMLALEVASALKDESRLLLYRTYCQQFNEQLIRRALAAVKQVPDDKIKKSRPALFIFLLKHYASAKE